METEKETKTLVTWESIPPSMTSKQTINPIRAIVDRIKVPKGTPEKPILALSIGDPAVFGNLEPPQFVLDAAVDAIKSNKYNGYPPSTGLMIAKEALVKRYNSTSTPLTTDDVIITSGGSGALLIAITALADPKDNILTPKPGFSIYGTICGNYNIEQRLYKLQPSNNWEIDLEHLESLIDSRTRAILINNPSNPAGSNYSKRHLLQILAVAEKHRLPIISDEMYANMVFTGETFISIPELSTEVPVLVVSGVSKQFLIPGWRIGWLLLHDRKNRLQNVRNGCIQLSQVILGGNSIVQGALPAMLKHMDEFMVKLSSTLESQAMCIYTICKGIPGLKPIKPQGAMYLMVGIDIEYFEDIVDDRDFAQKLLNEEFVFVLPGSCFHAPNFFRIVFCASTHILTQAAQRIKSFCSQHSKSSNHVSMNGNGTIDQIAMNDKDRNVGNGNHVASHPKNIINGTSLSKM